MLQNHVERCSELPKTTTFAHRQSWPPLWPWVLVPAQLWSTITTLIGDVIPHIVFSGQAYHFRWTLQFLMVKLIFGRWNAQNAGCNSIPVLEFLVFGGVLSEIGGWSLTCCVSVGRWTLMSCWQNLDFGFWQIPAVNSKIFPWQGSVRINCKFSFHLCTGCSYRFVCFWTHLKSIAIIQKSYIYIYILVI